MDAAATGKRIAALRRQKGWTQKQLAEQLHVTDKAVSKWERGLNFPDLGLIEPLAASKLFADNGLYGLPQILTAGMLGFTGALIGGAVYTLKNARRL